MLTTRTRYNRICCISSYKILLYLVLGVNLFPQKRIVNESSPIIDSTPSPTYYASTTAVINLLTRSKWERA